jgi:predicted neuraminidase
MCHAATLAALPSGDVLVSWFWGTAEGSADTSIWLSRRTASGWQVPVKVTDREATPHWNPVLFLAPDGTVYLYYKIGKKISEWQTWCIASVDGGLTWSSPEELVPGDRGGRGPVKNKPIVASNSAWLAPASREGERWDCFVDISMDAGRTWQSSPLVPVEHDTFPGLGVIQPTLWESEPGSVHMLMRSTCGFVCRSDSADYGLIWSPAYPTTLPNNNSGIDLARLPNGDLLLAHNPVRANWGARTPLVLSISRDNGLSWNRLLTLEDEEVPPDFAGVSPADTGIRIDSRAEFSYPAVIPLGSGVAVAYTWKRKRMAFVKLTALEIERWNVSSLKGENV